MATAQIRQESTKEKIIRTLWEFDTTEPVESSRIRSATGISNQLLNYHLKQQRKEGYVEKVGTKDVGSEKDAYTYVLTEAGTELGEELSERHEERLRELADAEVMERLRELQGRLNDLEAKQERETNELAERFDALKEHIKPLFQAWKSGDLGETETEAE